MFIWIGGLLVLFAVLHLLASWAEGRGWIIYRRSAPGRRGRGVALSNAMAELEVLLNPASEHRVEEERSRQVVSDEIDIEMDESGPVHFRGPWDETPGDPASPRT
ncbi:MAG TPA: hypothetical protein VK990_00900 [Acidimicrobiia bacterium]|nr:hypothetical protein [Acidimicrobiia bacterium]